MLEQMRHHSRSLLIYLLFAIIIAVFIVSFGPQSVGGFGGPGGTGQDVAVKVGGKEVTAQEYRQAFLLAGGDRYDLAQAKADRVREVVLDRIIERELFAQKAKDLGLVVSIEEAEDFVAEGKFMLFGGVRQFSGEQGFNYEDFTRFVRYYGFTPATFLQMQQRELQADRVRNFLKGGVAISPAEVRAEWEHRNRQVNLEYLRFPVSRFEAEVLPTEAEVAAHAAAHETDLKATFERDRAFRFSKLPNERKVEVVRLTLPPDASDADKEAAVKKLQPLATAASQQPLSAAAKKLAPETRSAVTQTAPAWRREGTLNMAEDVAAKVMAADEGAVVGPIVSEGAVVVAKVQGSREGDLTFEQVRLELAEEALRREQADQRAKAAAEAALAKAKKAIQEGGSKTLTEVFPAPAEQPSPSLAGDAPRAEETGLFTREGDVLEGIGQAPELAKTVWQTLTPEEPYFGPVQVAGAYVVGRLKERKEPVDAEFEKAQAGETQMAEAIKGYQVVMDWAQRQCSKLQQNNRIEVNADILLYQDGKSTGTYKPCTPFSPFGT